MSKILAAACAVLLFGAFGAGSALASNGGPCPPSSHNPGATPPNCGNGQGYHSTDPSCNDKIDNDGDGQKDQGDSECRDPGDGVEDGNPGDGGGGGGGGGGGEQPGCPPADGPISGVVQQISDGVRNGGGAPLADVLDSVNCQIIV